MSNGVPAISPEAREFVQAWAESAAAVLGQIAGMSIPVECAEAAPAEAPAPAETDVHITISASGALRGEASLRLPRKAVILLAQVLLGEPQDPAAEWNTGHAEAAEELFRQVAGHVTTSLKPRWGEVQLHVQSAQAPSWAPGATGWMFARPESQLQFSLEWQLSAALMAELRAAGPPATAAGATEAQLGQSGAAPYEISSASPGKLDLFMDVELGVVLRFGGRNMLLREILELGPGMVVELDRQVEEPADLLLDGKVIARGEVVVVDGNYGLRVTQIMAGEWPQNTGSA